MKVGVPREIKTHEYRVGLTPGAVREYVAAGHSVVVETNAGAGIGATDDSYRKAGAVILDSAREVFASSQMIVKVKEPQASEWSQLREDQILFTYLHLAPDPEQAKGLMASGCTAIAYETVTNAHGGLPLLAPMSEVAGRLAIEAAGAALRRHAGSAILISGDAQSYVPTKVESSYFIQYKMNYKVTLQIDGRTVSFSATGNAETYVPVREKQSKLECNYVLAECVGDDPRRRRGTSSLSSHP